jgi:HEAT repeat protein
MMHRRFHLVALAAVACAPVSAPAQSLASRIAEVRDGALTFHYAARAGVCGDGAHYVRIGRSYMGTFNSDMRSLPCDDGPVQVKLVMQDGAVQSVQSTVGPLRRADARDLGAVPASEAARYLLDLAAHGRGPASAKAVFPAVLADSATVWPSLLQIARDTATRSRATRQDAAFWLSRFAASTLAGHANSLADDEDRDERDDLKAHAVFVLSQLPHEEGVPTLLQVARTNRDTRVRGQALFWLGQSGDPRALALFEEVLRR